MTYSFVYINHSTALLYHKWVGLVIFRTNPVIFRTNPVIFRRIQSYLRQIPEGRCFEKSRIRETKHLSIDADSSTNNTVGWTKNTQKPDFFENGKIIQNAKTPKRLEICQY